MNQADTRYWRPVADSIEREYALRLIKSSTYRYPRPTKPKRRMKKVRK